MRYYPCHKIKKLILYGALNSTIDKRKGYQFLEPTFQELAKSGWGDKAELIVFGASEPLNTPDMGMKTQYRGHIHEDVSLAILYAAADVMLVPSNQEAFGQTASEAMACGTPVVSFGITGLLDVIEHTRTGYLAHPFETEDLAKGIEWVLTDDERWQLLSRQARRKVENEFAIEIVAQRFAGLYKEIVV